MWCKNMVFSIFLLLSLAISAIAGEYNILVVNETTQNSGAGLYVVLQYKNERGRTQNSSCTALRSYDDDMFYVKATIEAETEPKLTFYTNRGCRANSSIGSISPLAGTEPVSENLVITISDNGVTQKNSAEPITPPGEEGPKPQTNRKVIRFFAPWTNTSAILYVAGGESTKMTTVKNYCGWFEARISKPEGSFQVYFMQTIGYEYVSDIHNSSKITPIAQSTLLSLDDAAAEADTIWVKAGKDIGAATTVYTKYPGILGDCPTKTLPVMMFDWLHGTKGDIKKDGTVEGTNGDPANGVSADFGSGGCAHHITGMVEEYLGPNGVPVPATNFPENCQATTHIAQWFLPEVVAQKNGQPVTNATCRSIELNLDNDGLWLGQKDKNSLEGGLFLLDDFEYLDAERTIPNPYFDNISSGGKRHNFGFTMKIQATFEYIPGQYFEFFGDDDVWVFINNRLVVDIGGQHAQVAGAVDLDTLGLTEGVNYPFHIFYAERHTSESNFKMKTSIDLKTEASILAKDMSEAGLINYEIYQRVSKQALSCDFSGATTVDTVSAPSNFTLIGSGAYAEGVPLDSIGVWYGGITIKPGYTGFTINTELIRQMRTLPPGTYQLRFSLQADETQYDEITFVIDKYDTPPVAYARVDNQNQWTSLGSIVDGNTEKLNKESTNHWVNTRYAVNVMFDDGSSFDDIAYVITNNVAVTPCDENGTPITAITLKNGKATFYVKATAPVQGIKIIVTSADESQQAVWMNINFEEPPVPQIVYASIFDRDGDGRGDSVYAKLNKPVGTLNKMFTSMDSVQLEFGETFPTIPNDGHSIELRDFDSTMIITTLGGFGTVPFTGGAESVYSGKITPFWKYSEGATAVPTTISLTSDVADSIGPVITAADISYSDDGSTVLVLTFSEGLDCENEVEANYFRYYFKNTGLERQDIVPDILSKGKKNQWKLIFKSSSNDKDNIPVMGDSIKLVPGVHMDLLHRSTPENNPFVRIAGEQKVVVTSAPVVTIGESDSSRQIINTPTPTIPKLVQDDQPMTAKEVAQTFGTQGHYLGDLSLSNLVKDEVTNLQSSIKNFNAKSIEQGGPHLEEVLIQVQAGTMSIDQANKTYHLGDEIVNAYKNNIIDASDVTGIANGNASVTTKVMTKLAAKTTLEYQTQYFTSLGVFVNSNSGSVSCIDKPNTLFNGNCLDSNNDGKIFLAWNMRSKKGRLVGTGVYIARLSYKIRVGNRVVVDRTQDFLWGVRHGKTKGFEILLY